ncbi:hotdog domain-containing protein [Roseococcus thiosulfatophilus]|uniref:hotdog domain-containing protein n=1 Tax=Roseococcus thiosulfatophilus TaxID=35813 RepID=UPI001A8CCC9D
MDIQALEALMHAELPMTAAWGVRVLEAGGGEARLRLDPLPVLLRPGPTLSGPAMMGLADMAMWAALLAISEGEDRSLTSSLSMQFLRPAGNAAVVAHARLIKPKGRSLYGEVRITRAEDGVLVAHATSGWVTVSPAGGR